MAYYNPLMSLDDMQGGDQSPPTYPPWSQLDQQAGPIVQGGLGDAGAVPPAPSPQPLSSFIPEGGGQQGYQSNESDFTPPSPPNYPKASTGAEIKQHSKQLDEGVGFMPHFLATVAALSGNFGPAIALEEQKRKTALTKYMEPHVREINSLIAEGDLKGAGEATDNLISTVGSRAPELAGYFKEQRADIRQKQAHINAYKNYLVWLDSTLSEDDPRRKAYDAAKKIERTGGDTSGKFLDELVKSITPHIQIIDGQIVNVDPASGKSTQTPLTAQFEPGMLKGLAGQQAVAKFGMDQAQLVNLLRGQAVELPDGRKIDSTPQIRDEIRRSLQGSAKTESGMTIGAQAPLSAEQTALATSLGFTPEQIATRQFGREGAQAIMAGDVQQKSTIAAAAEMAKIMQNPAYAAQSGQGLMDFTPGPTFGETVPTSAATSLANIEKSGRNIVALPLTTIETKIRPLISSMNRLGEVGEMFRMYGLDSNSSLLDRSVSAINRKFSGWTGYTFSPNDTAGKVAEVIADKAIEDLVNSKNLPDTAVRQLKNMVKGIAANPDGAAAAVAEIMKVAQYELGQNIGKVNVDRQSAVQPYVKEDWFNLSQQFGVPPQIVAAIQGNEGSRDDQVSPAGAVGRFQVMPKTAKKYLDELKVGADQLALRPVNNYVALRYMQDLWNNYKDKPNPVQSVLAAYHGGPDAVLPNGQISNTKKEPDLPNRPGKYTKDYAEEGLARVYKAAGAKKPKITFSATGGR
jgi:soluble lytic murein transglycosylase-like protein